MANNGGRQQHIFACDLETVRQSVLYAEQRDKVQFVRQRSSKGFAAEG